MTDVTPVGLLVKRAQNVVSTMNEASPGGVDLVLVVIFSRTVKGISGRNLTSAEGAGTDICLSQIDAKIGQCASAGQVGPFGSSSGKVKIEVQSGKALVSQEGFSQ